MKEPVELRPLSQAVTRRFVTAVNFIVSEGNARSNSEIVTALGLADSTFRVASKGDRIIGLEYLLKLCADFDVSAEWLFLGRGQMRILPKSDDLKTMFQELRTTVASIESKAIFMEDLQKIVTEHTQRKAATKSETK